MPKKANPRRGKLRTFVERVNSDPLVRLQFLVDPVHAAEEAGIQLSKKSKSELQALVHEYVEKFPNIALLPTGLSSKSKERAVRLADVGTGSCRGGGKDGEVFII
jgi:hypothetical protein